MEQLTLFVLLLGLLTRLILLQQFQCCRYRCCRNGYLSARYISTGMDGRRQVTPTIVASASSLEQVDFPQPRFDPFTGIPHLLAAHGETLPDGRAGARCSIHRTPRPLFPGLCFAIF
jgi:hypothetical protein